MPRVTAPISIKLALPDKGRQSSIAVSFTFATTKSPKSLSLSEDARELGIRASHFEWDWTTDQQRFEMVRVHDRAERRRSASAGTARRPIA